MPDADPGDVFLRHRGAILDALLSDPHFGQTAVEDAQTETSNDVPVIGVDESLLGALRPVPDPEREPESEVESAVVGAAPAERKSRRSSSGLSSSDRINALLSGQPLAPTPEVPDYAAAAAERINREAQSDQEAAEQAVTRESGERPADRRPSPQQIAQEVATQLRKPRVALTVAAVVAVLIVILLVLTSGKGDEDTRPLAVAPAPATPTQSAPADTDVSGTIEVESAEAKCPPGSTDGMDAFSGEPDKAWSCVRAYKVDGQVLRIDLGKEYKVDSIGIVPGWDYVNSDGTDQWTKYRTVSRVSYRFDNKDKTTYTQETLDQRSLVVTRIEPPITASEIVLTVLKSNGESAENAVAISSIVITGKESK